MIILLDYDGVVNADESVYCRDHVFNVNRLTERIITVPGVGNFRSCYDPVVIDWINNINKDPDVKLFWLTSMFGYTDYLSHIGLDSDIKSIGPIPGSLHGFTTVRHGTWKRKTGLKVVNDNRKNGFKDTVIWVDNDPLINGGISNCTSLKTNPRFGLRNYHMNKINNLLNIEKNNKKTINKP